MSHKLLPLALCLVPSSLLLAKNELPPIPNSSTQPTRVITPGVAPEVLDRANVTISADFLWWKSYLGGVEFAISGIGDSIDQSLDNVAQRGKVKKPPFAWAPGIKLSLGVNYRLDNWNTTATYTGLFTDRERTSVHFDANKGLAANLPLYPAVGVELDVPAYGPFPIYEADCSWRQNFNVVDVDLARNFFISETLTLRPHFGLKFSWIEEKFAVNYPDVTFPSFPATVDNAFFEMRQRQWGLGIRGGMNGVWHITKEFGVYGDFAAAAMWSSFKTRINEEATITTEVSSHPETFVTTTPTILTTDGRLFEVLPVLELGLGFEYMLWFNNETCLFFAKAGWEEQVWSDFNQFVLPLERMHGDLSLHGLTIEAGFSF